jgi:hypothetical protein
MEVSARVTKTLRLFISLKNPNKDNKRKKKYKSLRNLREIQLVRKTVIMENM